MTPPVFINRIATAAPPHQVHEAFRIFAALQLREERDRQTYARMAERSQIARRWSVLEPSEPLGSGTTCGFYRAGEPFPTTGARMARYESAAPALAEATLDRLGLEAEGERITHLILATCTGFAAPET